MKSLEQIIKQEPVYLNSFTDKVNVLSEFNGLYTSKEEYEAKESPYPNKESWLERKAAMDVLLQNTPNILFASYGYENYSGDAFVLFEKDGKLYEVNGGHCSCYGLEGQWEPEETTLEVLKMRLEQGNLGEDSYSGNEFAKELKSFLGI